MGAKSLLWLAAWMLAGAPPCASDTPFEAAFSRPSTVWTCAPDNLHPPEYVTSGDVAGCRFTCDFSRVEPS